MMPHKFAKELTEIEIDTLKSCILYHKDGYCRMRAHTILLSARKYKIEEIADIYLVDRDTLSIWIDKWEALGIASIYNKERSGRPQKLSKEEQDFVLKIMEEEPRSVKNAVGALKDRYGKEVSPKTIKRLLGKLGKIWKRLRTSLKDKRDELAFRAAMLEIEELDYQHKQGIIDLYYFDQSGFALHPTIPYAWQNKGEHITLPANLGPRLNVLGIMNSECNKLTSFIFESRIDAEAVVRCIEDFSESITKPTWIVIDNASIHTATKVKQKIEQWQDKGLYLNYLPPYSPELNLIEILWRFIKYQWLTFSAYLSLANLNEQLKYILSNIGSKYQINFG